MKKKPAWKNRVVHRAWSEAVGPHRYRVRVFQDTPDGIIQVEIRDARQPGFRYRCLSLHHSDRLKAIKHAKVLSAWWRRTGRPPTMVWRRGRGPEPKHLAA